MRSCIICQQPLDFVNDDDGRVAEWYCSRCQLPNYIEFAIQFSRSEGCTEYFDIRQFVDINGKLLEDGQEAAKQLMLYRMKE